ncbi:EAL domain-containing protein [Henriciella sp. AS95]|uniref:putative bifunctional diguanylate cyclase/phosphodiesterase n=1 Tax=Henriciella sp. AS95 TaxID=3135782 RepID=UPI00317CB6FB
MLLKLRSLFNVQSDDPELNRARYRALSRQLPLMYGILAINMLALTITHRDLAPVWLTLIMPVLFISYMLARTVKYVMSRHTITEDSDIVKSLNNTIIQAGITAVCFAAWGLSFFQYGTAEHHSQLIFFIGLTSVTCAFCLMHLPQAALINFAVVTVASCIYLIQMQSTVFLAIAFNMVLVAVVFGTLLLNSERDFARMILQKKAQRRQHLRLQILNQENQKLANTDSLTGLSNRRLFLAEIDELVKQHELYASEFVVALMDLDGFKPINDVFGHPAGDQVLIQTADRLREAFAGEPVTIARLGGDEFGLLFRKPGTDDQVLETARRACKALKQAFQFDEGSANLTATIGMARFPTAADTRSHLFDRADYALYYAKQNSKAEPVFFSHEHERLIFANSAMEQALRHADLEKEMSVEFQPVLDLSTGHTRGLEALARWYSPQLGRVRPDLFITAAENIGMIGHLTEVLFRKAVAEAAHWPHQLILSFNLSAISLTSTGPVQRLLSIAENAGVSPQRLMFEITESAVMKDYDSAQEVLAIIREVGAHVAIDDFGTGFSSLAYVHRLPIDTLKVDRSFIRDLTRNEKSTNVLRSILSLCENLEIGCIIEGVETQEQFDLVTDLGGICIQGYYYSKPLSAGDTAMVLQIEFDEQEPVGQPRRMAAS